MHDAAPGSCLIESPFLLNLQPLVVFKMPTALAMVPAIQLRRRDNTARSGSVQPVCNSWIIFNADARRRPSSDDAVIVEYVIAGRIFFTNAAPVATVTAPRVSRRHWSSVSHLLSCFRCIDERSVAALQAAPNVEPVSPSGLVPKLQVLKHILIGLLPLFDCCSLIHPSHRVLLFGCA